VSDTIPRRTNVFLDCRTSPFTIVYFKLTVPRDSVSNFLYDIWKETEFGWSGHPRLRTWRNNARQEDFILHGG
jgi:hypothetical protein